MKKTFQGPDTIHPPAGDYSHAVRLELGGGALIFVSGQLPIDSRGDVVGGDDMGRQAKQASENVQAVLEANGVGMADVVKLTIYLVDTGRPGEMAAVRHHYLPDGPPPTSTVVEVSALAMPGTLIEIEAVAAT